MIRRATPIACALAVCAACSCGGGRDRLTIASGEAGSGEAALGRAIARIISDRARMQAAADPTGGPVDNLRRMREGRADFALATADVLADAVNGQGTFRGATVPARTVANLADSYAHLVVLDGSSINGLSGLRGRTVSTGAAGSATEFTALRVLREALLDPERDVKRQALGLSESTAALRERRIDAFFWMGGIPTPAIDALSRDARVKVRLVSTASVVMLLQRRFGESLYTVLEFPDGLYGSPEKAAGLGVATILVARGDTPDATVFAVARALLAGPEGLRAVLPETTLERAKRPAPAALHAGAARYYQETGR